MKKSTTLLLVLLVPGWLLPAVGQGYNSVVITEIMADPTPVVGLPNAEYLEILNRSNEPVSLRGWRLFIGNRSVVLPDSTLLPGRYALLSTRADAPLLSTFGTVIGLSSLGLPNPGASLALRNARGQLVFALTYSDRWWPPDRRAGGYALEMIDPDNPCGEAANWRVSQAAAGGTPGRPNSVRAANPDRVPPAVERVEVAAPNRLVVQFNERLDSISTQTGAIFELAGRRVVARVLDTPGFRRVTLTLDAPLMEQQSYLLTVRDVTDCAGNQLREVTVPVGVPSRAEPGDVLLSEILFNPRAGGVDFVEVHNPSGKFISLANWSLGSVSAGVAGAFRTLTAGDVVLAPGTYLAFTTNVAVLRQQYPTDRPANFLEVPSLPAFPNVQGGVVLRDATGREFDRLEYQENYHSPLLVNREGVSLERVRFEVPAQVPSNWHSAASTVGYATPGYANSQQVPTGETDGFVVEPEAFTPDGDGLDDYTTIRYTLTTAGRVGTIRVFDLSGRLVRYLAQNQLIGTSGDIRWDGTDQQGTPVRMGYYLLLIDTFDAAGFTQQVKKRVVVVR
jgi:hypothetical protein